MRDRQRIDQIAKADRMCAGMCDRPFGQHRIDRGAPERQQPLCIIELRKSNAAFGCDPGARHCNVRSFARPQKSAESGASQLGVSPVFDLDDLAMAIAPVDAKVRCVSPPAPLCSKWIVTGCAVTTALASMKLASVTKSPSRALSCSAIRSRAWNPVTCDRRLSGMRRSSSSIRKTTQYAILERLPVSSQTWDHTYART
ncbi:hypothetical protein ABIA06_005330 [Bradyrhizobium yuanmingense]